MPERIAASADLLGKLRRLAILTPAQLAEAPQHGDAQALARDLVRRGWLTPFQAIPETKPWGCMIQRAAATTKTSVTYAGHIALLLQRHCIHCHRPGGDAPFSLAGYDEARRWGSTMKVFTRSGAMPPWKPVNFGMFHDERRLSSAEKTLLAEWVDSGAGADRRAGAFHRRLDAGRPRSDPDGAGV